MLPVVQLPDVLAQVGSSDAGVTLNIHVVSEGKHHLLDLYGQLPGGGEAEDLGLSDGGVDTLEDGDREGGSLSSTGLSLGYDVTTLDDRLDSSLLDG